MGSHGTEHSTSTENTDENSLLMLVVPVLLQIHIHSNNVIFIRNIEHYVYTMTNKPGVDEDHSMYIRV